VVCKREVWGRRQRSLGLRESTLIIAASPECRTEERTGRRIGPVECDRSPGQRLNKVERFRVIAGMNVKVACLRVGCSEPAISA
jgi:hypothetical protein